MKRRFQYLYSRFGWAGVLCAARLHLGGRDPVFRVRHPEVRHPFYLRMRSSDIPTFDQVFTHREYDFRTSEDPQVIVDAGANIGLAAILFASRYPGARVIAIEPEAGNFELLQRNVAPYPNVEAVHAALWDKDERVHVVDPGLGEWAFRTEKVEAGSAPAQGEACHGSEGRTVDSLLREYEIPRVDILKVDIEGAEREVFRDPSAWIERVDGLIVELHERMVPGCRRTFYEGTRGFDHEWCQGENVFLSRGGRLRRSGV